MVEKYKPKESKEHPGFYIVPGHPSVLISLNDECIHPQSGDVIEVKLNTFLGGYLFAGNVSVHRLKCLAFNGPVTGYAKLMVNHKDGNKLNNEPDNLEWMTAQENAQHAYETGLRDDNTPILVKDTKTDEINRYYSLWAAAKVLKVNAGTIHKWLNRGDRNANVFRNQYVIIYEGDPWPTITKEDLVKVVKGTPIPVMCINLNTGEKAIYCNMRDAGRALGLNGMTLSIYLNRCEYGKSFAFRGYEFFRVDDPEIIRKMRDANFKQLKRGKLTKRKPIPIEVTNLESGLVTNWNSSEELAKHLGVPKNTLQKGVYVGNGIWRGLKVVYLTK